MGDDRPKAEHRAASGMHVEHLRVTPLDRAAQVTWDRPAGGPHVTSYDLTPCIHSGSLADQTVSVDGSACSMVIRSLENGETYTIRITPWHDGVPGPSVRSAPFQPFPPPGPPANVQVDAGEQSATVRWDPPGRGGPVGTYRVIATPADAAPVEVLPTQTSLLVTGLRDRRRYTFAVVAINTAGESASSPSNAAWPGDDLPPYLFPLMLGYLLILGLLAYLYALHYPPLGVPLPGGGIGSIPALRDVVPGRVAGVPVSIPWFGAVGATMIGLYGIFDHGRRDWQRRLNVWYVARPFTGATLAVVGVILFAGVIKAAGGNPSPQNQLNGAVYFAVAFLVGFREHTFRHLIARVADLLIGPGSDK